MRVGPIQEDSAAVEEHEGSLPGLVKHIETHLSLYTVDNACVMLSFSWIRIGCVQLLASDIVLQAWSGPNLMFLWLTHLPLKSLPAS